MSLILIGAVPPALAAPDATRLPDAVDTHFDTDTETWTVTAPGGGRAAAVVVVDARPSTDPAIASHGVPNYFRIPGPDRRQARYVARCLRLFERSGAARIEARKRRIVLHRWSRTPVCSQFYLTGSQPGPDEVYDGPATITVSGLDIHSRVRLTGHLDAIDGRYHWQGTVFETLPEAARGRTAGVTLTIEDRTAPARVVEQTPWGSHMIAGVGDPPFA